MKKLALVLSLLIALAMIAAVGYARLIFDPDEFVRTRPLEMAEEMGEQELQAMLKELAGSTHQGQAPCLRYPRGILAGEGEIEAVAAALLEDEFAPSLDGLVVLLFGWNEEREEKSHAKTRVNESWPYLVKCAGFWERIVIFLAGDRLLESAERFAQESWDELRNQNRELIESLDESRIGRLKRIWETCPACFTFPAYVRVENRVKTKLTLQRMERLSAAIRSWKKEKGALPGRMEDLVFGGKDPFEDGWRMPFTYRIEGNRAVLRSYGADMIEGGENENADIELAVP